MKILIPNDKNFEYEKCKELYEYNEDLMGNNCTFDDLILKTHFFSFYEKNILKGCIYISNEDGNLYLSGFSVRKNHLFNIKAIKRVLSFYNCSIYSKTKHKTAKFLLKKCGFDVIKTGSDGIIYMVKKKEKM